MSQFPHGAVVGGSGELQVGVDDAAPGSIASRLLRLLVVLTTELEEVVLGLGLTLGKRVHGLASSTRGHRVVAGNVPIYRN